MNPEKLLGVAALLVVLAACDPATPDGSGANAAAALPPTATPRSCEPVDVEHRFGTTRVSVSADRIVPLSVRDQEVLAALGIPPMAVVDMHYLVPWVERPWVPDGIVGPDPEILAGTAPNFEQIARLGPKLLVGYSSGLTDREYRILSRLAPTLAQSATYVDHGVPWQNLTRTLGRALCRTREAGALVESIESRLLEIRALNSGFEGRTIVVAMAGGPEGTHWVFGPQDSRVRFLESLGFRLAPGVAGIARQRFVGTLSPERLDLLDNDLLVWLASPAQREALESDPLYRALEVVQHGRVLHLEPDGPEVAALTNTSPLNLPWLLDSFVPRVARALEGAAPGDR